MYNFISREVFFEKFGIICKETQFSVLLSPMECRCFFFFFFLNKYQSLKVNHGVRTAASFSFKSENKYQGMGVSGFIFNPKNFRIALQQYNTKT